MVNFRFKQTSTKTFYYGGFERKDDWDPDDKIPLNLCSTIIQPLTRTDSNEDGHNFVEKQKPNWVISISSKK